MVKIKFVFFLVSLIILNSCTTTSVVPDEGPCRWEAQGWEYQKFLDFQKGLSIVLKNQKQKKSITRYVGAPFFLKSDGKAIIYENTEDVLKAYPSIFTKSVVDSVLSAKREDFQCDRTDLVLLSSNLKIYRDEKGSFRIYSVGK